VVGEDQPAPRARALEGGQQVRTAGGELVDLDRDPFALQDLLVELRGPQLVARRVGGIDLQVLAEEVDGQLLVCERGRIAGGSGDRQQRRGKHEGYRAHSTSSADGGGYHPGV
jgi:hypothetical protein